MMRRIDASHSIERFKHLWQRIINLVFSLRIYGDSSGLQRSVNAFYLIPERIGIRMEFIIG